MAVFYGLLGMIAAVTAAVTLYILSQGNENFTVLTEQRGPLFRLGTTERTISFSSLVPFENKGRQAAFVMDVFPRVLLPEEQFDLGRVSARLERFDARRSDGYMEAFPVSAGKRGDFILIIEITLPDDHRFEELPAGITDVPVDIYYSVVGRTSPRLGKTPLVISLEEFGRAEVVDI